MRGIGALGPGLKAIVIVMRLRLGRLAAPSGIVQTGRGRFSRAERRRLASAQDAIGPLAGSSSPGGVDAYQAVP